MDTMATHWTKRTRAYLYLRYIQCLVGGGVNHVGNVVPTGYRSYLEELQREMEDSRREPEYCRYSVHLLFLFCV